jgi:C1A family cysteine protease
LHIYSRFIKIVDYKLKFKKEVSMGKIKKSNSKNHSYGWTPDLPDQRDYIYKRAFKLFRLTPKKVDLRSLCSPVENQGNLGSCTANAIAGALEFLEKKNKVSFVDMSRLFIYYNERVIEHSVDSDSGAMIRDGIKSLKKQGVCSEKSWPYIISKFTVKPSITCYKEALNHQITSYRRITTFEDMRQCLAEGFPFVFGFTVYESFESQTVAKTGIVNMPKSNESVLGGHAVLAVGYNDKDKRFIVRNSWGTRWGIKGYFTMPYDYLADRNLSDDFWTIRSVEAM